jgi:hypothetical protein
MIGKDASEDHTGKLYLYPPSAKVEGSNLDGDRKRDEISTIGDRLVLYKSRDVVNEVSTPPDRGPFPFY